jgi:hypothetical protein
MCWCESPREQARFVSDLLGGIKPESLVVEQLDGHPPLELAILGLPQPHGPHAAASEQSLEGIRTDLSTGKCREPRFARYRIELERLIEVRRYHGPQYVVRF